MHTSPPGCQVIELRRYRTKPGARAAFARCFETWFPDVFQQLGAAVYGHFAERARPDGFTWLRGFTDMDARLAVNQAFYFGPVWREHKPALNALLDDNDDVLLLRPLHPYT
ncbi:MAG TPA: NIPSNAP family protein, partial [Burkholderiaceae bacterium]